MEIAVDKSQRRCIALLVVEDGVDPFRGKDSSQQSADCTADTVNPESVEGVVISEKALYLRYHQETDNAGYESNHKSGGWRDKPGRGSNRNQSGHGPRDASKNAWFAAVKPLRGTPSDGSG